MAGDLTVSAVPRSPLRSKGEPASRFSKMRSKIQMKFRRRRLPRHLERQRLSAHPGASAGAGDSDHLASGYRPAGLRRRHPAGRLLLWRLPARRRHRALRPGDGRRHSVRRARRAGAGHLQRLPDSAGGRPAARRDAAQRQPGVPLPVDASARGERRTPFTRLLRPGQVIRVPISHGEGNYFADDATLDALEASNGVLFRYCEPDGDMHARRQPQWLAPQHRRHRQRRAQRRRR